jgi:1,4-dihydroxy-6-naphthoate synthase
VLTLGYSPCPNDCFIFYALAHGLIDTPFALEIELHDVEALNRLAARGELDVAKVSYAASFHLLDEYAMLRSGGALGWGVGPLVVTREPLTSLAGKRIAMPGRLTTATLLLRLWQPEETELVELRYDRIMPAVAAGDVDAGLIIHEARFTYSRYGLVKHRDLGEWWHEQTGELLPLGGIVARRSLGPSRLAQVEAAIRSSLRFAFDHPRDTEAYVAAHAQEMEPAVRQQHIDLYVNAYSLDVGDEGQRAAKTLRRCAIERGLAPATPAGLFFEGVV